MVRRHGPFIDLEAQLCWKIEEFERDFFHGLKLLRSAAFGSCNSACLLAFLLWDAREGACTKNKVARGWMRHVEIKSCELFVRRFYLMVRCVGRSELVAVHG